MDGLIVGIIVLVLLGGLSVLLYRGNSKAAQLHASRQQEQLRLLLWFYGIASRSPGSVSMQDLAEIRGIIVLGSGGETEDLLRKILEKSETTGQLPPVLSPGTKHFTEVCSAIYKVIHREIERQYN